MQFDGYVQFGIFFECGYYLVQCVVWLVGVYVGLYLDYFEVVFFYIVFDGFYVVLYVVVWVVDEVIEEVVGVGLYYFECVCYVGVDGFVV